VTAKAERIAAKIKTFILYKEYEGSKMSRYFLEKEAAVYRLISDI